MPFVFGSLRSSAVGFIDRQKVEFESTGTTEIINNLSPCIRRVVGFAECKGICHDGFVPHLSARYGCSSPSALDVRFHGRFNDDISGITASPRYFITWHRHPMGRTSLGLSRASLVMNITQAVNVVSFPGHWSLQVSSA